MSSDRDTPACACGNLDDAKRAMSLATLMDSKRVPGGPIVLSRRDAEEIQVALENAVGAHNAACVCVAPSLEGTEATAPALEYDAANMCACSHWHHSHNQNECTICGCAEFEPMYSGLSDGLAEAEYYIAALRGPLLHYFGTTDPELLAEVWEDRIRGIEKQPDGSGEGSTPAPDVPAAPPDIDDLVGLLRDYAADLAEHARRHAHQPPRRVEFERDAEKMRLLASRLPSLLAAAPPQDDTPLTEVLAEIRALNAFSHDSGAASPELRNEMDLMSGAAATSFQNFEAKLGEPTDTERLDWDAIAEYLQTVARKAFARGYALAEEENGINHDYVRRAEGAAYYTATGFDAETVKQFHPGAKTPA